MVSIDIEGVSAKELEAAIEYELARQKSIQIALEQTPKQPHLDGGDRKLKLASIAPPLKSKQRYSYEDLTCYHGEEFVTNCYKALLKRLPDAHGQAHYLQLLQSGKLSKSDIISRIRFSKEGREKGVELLGAKKRYTLMLLRSLPIVGGVFEYFWLLVTLPRLARSVRRVESFAYDLFKAGYRNDQALAEAIEQKASKQALALLQERLDATKEELNSTKEHLDTTKEELKSTKEHLDTTKEELESTKSALSKMQKELEDRATKEMLDRYQSILSNNAALIASTIHTLQELSKQAKKSLELDTPKESKQAAKAKLEGIVLDRFYKAFEDRFRGSPSQIQKRLKVYLPYIQALPFDKEALSVLDIGCGRGEWLDLLRQQGLERLYGVDLNEAMVQHSKELGFEVAKLDALEYLQGLKENSLALITGFHIIEHLPFKQLLLLLYESYRVLKHGGMVIFETPNPENITVGACNFYTDPTHKNPLPPPTTEFMLQEAGFVDVEIKRLNLSKEVHYLKGKEHNDLNELLFAFTKEQDYAAIGYKK